MDQFCGHLSARSIEEINRAHEKTAAPPAPEEGKVNRILPTSSRSYEASYSDVGGQRSSGAGSGPFRNSEGFDPKSERAKETLWSRLKNAPGRIKSRAKDYARGAKRQAEKVGPAARQAAKQTANKGLRFGQEAVMDLGEDAYRTFKGRERLMGPAIGLLALGGLGGAAAMTDNDKLKRTQDVPDKGALKATLNDDRAEGVWDNTSDTVRRKLSMDGGMFGGGVAGAALGALGGYGAKRLGSRIGSKVLGSSAGKKVMKAPLTGIGFASGAGAGSLFGGVNAVDKAEKAIDKKYE